MVFNGENLLPCEGEVFYQPDFLTQTEAETYYRSLTENIPWQHQAIKIFGKSVMQPRLTAWFGDSGANYSYSQLKLQSQPWTSELCRLKSAVEKAAAFSFNSVLLNLYRDGRDSNGWHSDDEKELGEEPVIASLSLGESRDFILRRKIDNTQKVKIELRPGSLLLMKGLTQKNWQHCLPKRQTVKGPRINLTFRRVKISV